MPCEIMYSLQPEYLSRYTCLSLSLTHVQRCLSPHVCSLRDLQPYTMPIRWIGGVLPKTTEQDAGSGYCDAWHAETSGTSGTGETRPELNSSPTPAFSEAAGVVSTARIERGPSNSLYFSLGEWSRLGTAIFFVRTVYVGLSGKTSVLGTGPFWAY